MIEREIWPRLKSELTSDEMIVITGPRQVGKTTTVKWLLDQVESNKFYLDLTQIATQKIFEYDNFDNTINQLTNMGVDFSARPVIAIDEIQYSKGLPRVIKYIYDNYNVKFILTGSSAYYLKNHFSESLAGRKLVFEILPLTFREFLKVQGVKYAPHKIEFDEISNVSFDQMTYESIKSYYEEYIEFGGYPAVVASDSNARKSQLLEEIYSSYINLDVRLLADFRSINDLQRIISLVGARVGSRLNIDDLSKITGLSRPTISNYITFLEQTYILKMVPAYSNNINVKVRLPRKPYFVDNGIANINSDLSGGAKFENMICHQLGFYGKLSFYNSKEGEIDFIVEKDNERYAFEVKETPTNNYLRKLQSLSENINVARSALIGRYDVAKFQNYIWGGVL